MSISPNFLNEVFLVEAARSKLKQWHGLDFEETRTSESRVAVKIPLWSTKLKGKGAVEHLVDVKPSGGSECAGKFDCDSPTACRESIDVLVTISASRSCENRVFMS